MFLGNLAVQIKELKSPKVYPAGGTGRASVSATLTLCAATGPAGLAANRRVPSQVPRPVLCTAPSRSTAPGWGAPLRLARSRFQRDYQVEFKLVLGGQGANV